MHRIQVRTVMKSKVITIHPEDLVADAAELMQEHTLRRLPVVDDADCLVGIITDSDVREADAAGRVLNRYEPGAEDEWLTVAEVMTSDVVTIHPDATLGELAARLVQYKVGGVPVVEPDPHLSKKQHLVGIITETDIFNMIADAWRAETSAAT